MVEVVRSLTWEAPAHHHVKKNPDWFWTLGLLALAGTVAAFIFGNILFGMVILLGAVTVVIVALHEPAAVPFAITTRGVRVGEELHPYTSLESFYIDEDHPHGPHLLVKSVRMFMPLIVIPLPEEYVDDVDDMVSARIPEEQLEEPFAHRLLEFLGF